MANVVWADAPTSAGPRLRAAQSEATAHARRLPRLDRPWVVALVGLCAGALLAGARLLVFAHGDPSRFIFAGTEYARGADLYHHIHLFHASSGYDGQFFYRLALDPAQLGQTAFGITLDTFFRLQRIGYPVMAWLLAGGRGALVPWSLIAVNVGALGLLGFASGALARDSGRHALAGLLLVGYWGYAFSLSRDTAEIPTAALTMAALLALRRGRPWWAAALLTGAVLTRETALLVVAAVALHDLQARLRGRGPRDRGWSNGAAWIAPSVAFLGWQLVIRAARGGVAGAVGAAADLGVPFKAFLLAVDRDLLAISQVSSVRDPVQLIALLMSLRDLLQLIVLVGVCVLAVRSLRTSTAPTTEKTAFALMVVLATCLDPSNLVHLANQRSLDELYLLAGLVLLGSGRRLAVPGSLVVALWLSVAVKAVLFV